MIPEVGLYLFTYPGFADKSQWVYIHWVTPDQQQAFVTYPYHRFSKAAQLLSVSWFETVNMVAVPGDSPLMSFLESTLPQLLSPSMPTMQTADTLVSQF